MRDSMIVKTFRNYKESRGMRPCRANVAQPTAAAPADRAIGYVEAGIGHIAIRMHGAAPPTAGIGWSLDAIVYCALHDEKLRQTVNSVYISAALCFRENDAINACVSW